MLLIGDSNFMDQSTSFSAFGCYSKFMDQSCSLSDLAG